MMLHRPLMVIVVVTLLGISGTVYLAAYWNAEYGALAQPARAIRSQIDPSPRDESSDTYRDAERYNLIATIRGNRIFGVGFGNEFGRYVALPDLTGFWPLQFHTPHQNIYWLWLKMGVVGVSVVLAIFMAALARCMRSIFRRPEMDGVWLTAAVVATGLLMFLMFATVDVVFPSPRGMVVLGVLFALAFASSPTEKARE
jgi:O-antigen ligase